MSGFNHFHLEAGGTVGRDMCGVAECAMLARAGRTFNVRYQCHRCGHKIAACAYAAGQAPVMRVCDACGGFMAGWYVFDKAGG